MFFSTDISAQQGFSIDLQTPSMQINGVDFPPLPTGFDAPTIGQNTAPIVVAQAFGGLEIAQSGSTGLGALGEPIGQISESQGNVSITRVDGNTATASVGNNIYQGDTLTTDAGASAAIVFVDNTIFSLDDEGEMVIDEMVYDPGTQSGAFNAQVIKGVFSFVSGDLAKTSPDGMVVNTPTSTIGIRGSTVLGRAGPEGTENKITLVKDIDGNLGEILISTPLGQVVLSQAGASSSVFSATQPPSQVVVLSPQDIQTEFGSTLTKLVKVVAQKAQTDAQAAQDNAAQTQAEAEATAQEAQQAEQNAAAAEQAAAEQTEAAAQAEAEALAAQAEAEALAAEAEAALLAAQSNGDPQAIAEAQALEALAAEAFLQAQDLQNQATVEAQQRDELQAQAEAAALAAQDLAQQAAFIGQEALNAAALAQQHAEFSDMAGAASQFQDQIFAEFLASGVVSADFMPGDLPPGGPGDLADQAGLADQSDTVDPNEPIGLGESPFGYDPFGDTLGLDAGLEFVEMLLTYEIAFLEYGLYSDEFLLGAEFLYDDDYEDNDFSGSQIGGGQISGEVIYGTDGNDTLNGTDADDDIFGEDGDDTINAGAGVDLIIGGRGADNLTGGSGADIFVYTTGYHSDGTYGVDTITDFEAGGDGTANVDTLHIADDWGVGTSLWFNQSLTDTGGDTINWTNDGRIEAMLDTNGGTSLKIDLNADGAFDLTNDMEINVSGYTGTFDTSDFIFT